MRRLLHKKLLIPLLIFSVFLIFFVREYELILREPIQAWSDDITADCAVVLTGGVGRVREGFDLLSRGQIKKLVISGVHRDVQLSELMAFSPFYGNLSEKDVVLDRRSGTTYGNAQQTLPIVEALGCRDVALVTSNLHMFRAYRTFMASYPANIKIYKYSVNTLRSEMGFYEVSTEVLKSLFYALWAY